ncbi:MAG: MarR family winged helix-turn-helix transcriptional regulator [Gallintestinimicrobium sp.]
MGRRSSILSIWCGTIRHHTGAAAGRIKDRQGLRRAAASLEAKGYLIRRDNPEDKRSQLLYATKKAEGLKNSKVSIESTFYEWLMEELDESETEHFCEMLDRLYLRSKKESRSGFLQVKERMDRGEKDG